MRGHPSGYGVAFMIPRKFPRRQIGPAQRPLNSRLDCAALAAEFGITENQLINNFHLIQQDWKTGET